MAEDDFILEQYFSLLERIGNKRKETMKASLLKKYKESEAEKVLSEIEKLGEQISPEGEPKIETAALHWAKLGTVVLPEDNSKIDRAVKIATNKGLDPLQFNSPMELINQFVSVEEGAELIDPDTVPEFTNKQVLSNGAVVYDVSDDEAGRLAVRKILNNNYGNGFNPWCIAYGNGKGGLSTQARQYWEKYSVGPKQIAFKDGKAIAFHAADEYIGEGERGATKEEAREEAELYSFMYDEGKKSHFGQDKSVESEIANQIEPYERDMRMSFSFSELPWDSLFIPLIDDHYTDYLGTTPDKRGILDKVREFRLAERGSLDFFKFFNREEIDELVDMLDELKYTVEEQWLERISANPSEVVLDEENSCYAVYDDGVRVKSFCYQTTEDEDNGYVWWDLNDESFNNLGSIILRNG